MEKTEQLKSILTDLDNKELTKHQAHDLICVLFSVSQQRELLKAFYNFLDTREHLYHDEDNIDDFLNSL